MLLIVEVILHIQNFCLLLQSFCLPVILYGLEVTEPHKSVLLTMLNNLINRAVYKIFKASDKDVICHIRECLGLHDIDVLCKRETWKISEEVWVVETCCLALSDSSVQFL